MDDDRNKIILGIGLLMLGVMFFGMLFFRPAKPKPGIDSPPPRVAGKKNEPTKTYQQKPSQQQAMRRVGPRTIRGAEAAAKAREAHHAEIRAAGAKWLEKMIDDPTISAHTRELYAARNNPNVQMAVYYLYNGDKLHAAEEFEKAALDPENRLSVRFIALRQRFFLARTNGTPEDYFKWGKMLGEMLKDNDLSFFDQKQNSEFLDRIKYQEIYYKARNDPAMQEAIASYLLKEKKGYDRHLAMEEVKRRIRDVEEELQG
ncbi:MAG: hypothetical protein GQF41_3596 [Candidatus Rifleibacterium amylolyticum]|nr:MAG: hypothetical protein GQF41_3596 [Candidatus Rifleibacterium amylolyticum]NLF95817.1 hypothetical protein [Candidatus Riflebacteria bacterium]